MDICRVQVEVLEYPIMLRTPRESAGSVVFPGPILAEQDRPSRRPALPVRESQASASLRSNVRSPPRVTGSTSRSSALSSGRRQMRRSVEICWTFRFDMAAFRQWLSRVFRRRDPTTDGRTRLIHAILSIRDASRAGWTVAQVQTRRASDHVKLFKLPIQRGEPQPQAPCRFALVVVAFAEHALECRTRSYSRTAAPQVVDRRLPRRLAAISPVAKSTGESGSRPSLKMTVRRSRRVVELQTDVACPRGRDQPADRSVIDAVDAFAQARAVPGSQHRHERRYVLPAVPQRRQVDRHHIQPVKQISPKPVGSGDFTAPGLCWSR